MTVNRTAQTHRPFTPDAERDRAREQGDDPRSVPFLMRFTVFNADQCESLPEEIEPINWHRTALHELGHSSGAANRLGRDLSGAFGSKAYAKEELVAEMTVAFTCAALGIAVAGYGTSLIFEVSVEAAGLPPNARQALRGELAKVAGEFATAG